MTITKGTNNVVASTVVISHFSYNCNAVRNLNISKFKILFVIFIFIQKNIKRYSVFCTQFLIKPIKP